MSLSNHLHHIVQTRAPFPAKVWHSHSLRAKQPCSYPRWHVRWLGIYGCGRAHQPCHADAGMHVCGHLLLHAGVPLSFTTCLKSYRPYGAPLPHPTSSRNGVALHHREEERRSNPFMTDLRKIYFPKNIHFISRHLPDSKRQQTTTVDYKRLING